MHFLKPITLRLWAIGLLTSCLVCPVGLAQTNNAFKAKSITQSQAIAMAKKRVDGRVLRVEQNGQIYKVKMLKQSGRVVSVSVNRVTGKIEKTSAVKTLKE